MKTVIIGAGPAGLMAAASSEGQSVTVIEQNEKAGKKLYITGKGRCNLTNNVESGEFLSNVVTNPKFLLSALNSFPPRAAIEFFEKHGLKLKTERGGRVFPESDKASDVTAALLKACKDKNVNICLNEKAEEIIVVGRDDPGAPQNNYRRVAALKTSKREIPCDKLIIATGGMSYPLTGSTGGGYKLAESLGHNIIKPVPSLTGLNLTGGFFKALQGLSLKNVRVTVFKNNIKTNISYFGEALFTYFGISGPVILSVSAHINREALNGVSLSLDLKPALTEDVLEARVLRDFDECKNVFIKNALAKLLPHALIPVILSDCKISPDKQCNAVTKAERAALIKSLKAFKMPVLSPRGFDEAIVTSGGVDVKEINPKTMESKLVKGLYFCGEVLDADALTGGYNIQIALSTGFLAGKSM